MDLPRESNLKNKKIKNWSKILLANPFQTNCLTLSFEELKSFGLILQNMLDINLGSKGLKNEKSIGLGLDYCLRAINNCQASCIFISLGMKPHFLINLIQRNVEVKSSNVPVFAINNLEEFTNQLFGQKTLALTISSELSKLTQDLRKWIEKWQYTLNSSLGTTLQTLNPKPEKKKSLDVQIRQISLNNFKKKLVKCSNNDFLALVEIIGMGDTLDGQRQLKVTSDYSPKNIGNPETKNLNTSLQINMKSKLKLNNTDSKMLPEKFLMDYHPLCIYKIRPNPNKKPKMKKLTKNKKKISRNNSKQ